MFLYLDYSPQFTEPLVQTPHGFQPLSLNIVYATRMFVSISLRASGFSLICRHPTWNNPILPVHPLWLSCPFTAVGLRSLSAIATDTAISPSSPKTSWIFAMICVFSFSAYTTDKVASEATFFVIQVSSC